jgi:NAD(P)H dehydrogenase (quinone)
MYVVLGATGKVGGAAVRELRRRGLPVRAVVRDAAKAGGLAAAGCDVAVADYHDAAAVREALAGASRVHVILPMNGTAQDGLADADRIIAAIGGALDHMRPEHVVAISDYGAHNSTKIGLTQIWHRLEERLRSSPFASTVLRSAEHMEGWTGALRLAAKGEAVPLIHQPLTKSIPTVSAPDVGLIAADILVGAPGDSAGTRVVHVEGPRRYTIAEMVETIADVVGHPVEVRELPRECWVAAYLSRGLSESYARLVAEMVGENNAGRLDVEPGEAEVRRGTTTFAAVLAAAHQQV